MWSDRYYYLNIVSDLKLSSEHRTQDLTAFLCKQPELAQVSEFKYQNSVDFPIFLNIQLLKASSYHSWSDADVSHDATNMIAVVCSKGKSDNYELAMNLLVRIAQFLNWQLIDEETDDGMENHLLLKP